MTFQPPSPPSRPASPPAATGPSQSLGFALTLALGLSFGPALTPHAGAAVIDFDDAPNGTIIDNRYPGVTFGCVACTSGHAYARDMNSFGSTTAASGANVITLVDPASSTITSFNTLMGAVSATFATPVRRVSIDARPQLPLEFLGTANNKPFLEAYSSTTQNASTFLGRVLYPLNFGDPGYCSPSAAACGGTWQTLTFESATDNIVSIRLSSQNSQSGPPVYGDFDNLRFEAGSSLIAAQAVRSFEANFDSALPAAMRAFGGARAEAGYLKLNTVGTADTFGIVYLDDFGGGTPVHGFRAEFDATLFGSSCCAFGLFPADGFSFNLVPAATVLPNPGYAEPGEEGLPQGLSVCFDTWDNGNAEGPAVDVKWLGQTIATVPYQSSQSPAGITDPVAARRQVTIQLDPDGTIDVRYGNDVLFTDLPTPYRPSVIGTPKWVIGARIGLATDNHWIDNLRITSFAGPQRCLDFNAAPAASSDLPLFGGARVEDGWLKLVRAGIDGHGISYIPDFGGGQLVGGFRATFRAALFGSTCCGGGAFPADGFSFNLAPAATVRSSPLYNEPGEEGLDEGLAVNFDTWDNEVGEAPAIEVKWLGQIIARTSFQPSQSPAGITTAAAAARDVVIDLRGDGRIDVLYGGVKVIDNVQTPFDPLVIGTPVWVLGARVGGANDNHWIDDLCITTIGSRARPIPTLFSTGVNDARRALADNAVDPHYVVLPNGPSIFPSFPVYAATSAGGFPVPPWLGDSTNSAWISQAQDTVIRGGTNFTYETRFNLAGFNPASARITGRWAADNRGVGVQLNGAVISTPLPQSFDVWTPLTINNGFVPGVNVLRFTIENLPALLEPNFQNPGGVRVELSGTAELDCSGNPAPDRPVLRVRRVNAAVEASWRGTGWRLQGASAVDGPWVDLTRGNSSNGTDYSAAFPADHFVARFFRLRLDCD